MLGQRIRVYLVVAVVLVVTFGWIGTSLYRNRSGATGAQGVPANVIAPVGQPVGWARPQPSSLHAAFPVSVPAVDLTGPNVPIPDVTVDTDPGQVSTIAGSGSDLTKDGAGKEAAFGTMGGVTVVGGIAYVMTQDAVRTVDLKTGRVGTLAGSPGATACLAGATGATSGFYGLPGNAANDGTDLFMASGGCGIAKISIATGAATFLEPWPGPLTVGPDGFLYAASTPDGQRSIERIDPASGAEQTYLELPKDSFVMGLAADSTSLWASVDEGPSSPAVLDQIMFADGSVTRFAFPGVDVVGAGQLASAGYYLYAPSVNHYGLLRFVKRTGSWNLAVGGDPGNVDGMMANGEFGYVRGIASDGAMSIWIGDDGNHTFRKVIFSEAGGLSMGP